MSEYNDNSAVNELISALKLPQSYLTTVNEWLRPIAQEINQSIKQSIAPNESKKSVFTLIGVQGAQGSGKSTCSEFFKALFEHNYGLRTAVLSIDDFYLTYAERQDLAKNVHPLLATRGVPGTHDIGLTLDTITALRSADENSITLIPRFDKAIDDRKPESQWDKIHGKIDIVILEGWFIGLTCPEKTTIYTPVNKLESEEDPDGRWRNYVHDQLQDYQTLFNQLDKLLVLKAPSFDCIFQWRLKQEEKLIASVASRSPSEDEKPIRTLTPVEVRRFISHFERLTLHALDSLPKQADWCLYLNEKQAIEKRTTKIEFPPFIIVTDLDGTLLDHYTYSWEAAKPAMEFAQTLSIPIIINTSKTRQEVELLQNNLSICAPFIVENGSALYIPQDFYTSETQNKLLDLGTQENALIQLLFGATRSTICEFVYQLRNEHRFKFSGYSDWNIEKLMQITGLDEVGAKLSMQRSFSEPLVWDDSDQNFEHFASLIEQKGLKILKGGRFIHILGKTNKAKPMEFLMEAVYNNNVTQSICLGDSPNDIDMLNKSDYAVCVKSPTGNYPKLTAKGITYHTEELGPKGWNEAILKILPTSP